MLPQIRRRKSYSMGREDSRLMGAGNKSKTFLGTSDLGFQKWSLTRRAA